MKHAGDVVSFFRQSISLLIEQVYRYSSAWYVYDV